MPVTQTRILIIEDSEEIAMIEVTLLESAGYAVQHALTGAEGIERLRQWQPDILILDLMLPDTEGMTILQGMPQMRLKSAPDIIVLSGHDDPELTYQCLRAGAHDFIRKPFQNEEFLLRVSSLVQLREYKTMTGLLQAKTADDLRKLSKYFSNDIIEAILDGSISTDPGGETMTATFMMFDLRGSTAIAERLGPQRFFIFLSELFSDITDLIFNNGGAINKFTGDGFLVTFGLRNYTEESTHDAMQCAFKIREHFELYNQVKPNDITEDLRFGIGITTGEVFAGNIGNVHRLEYTILGDPVNLSARLESLTKKANVDMLIDGRTRQILGNTVVLKTLSTTAIRGKNNQVEIYYPVRAAEKDQ
jgi:adenylate cyclase